MKKLLSLTLAAIILATAFACVPASAASDACATQYPILLVHGAGFRDKFWGIFNFWGRIPKELENNGAKIYYGGTDAWGSVERSADILRKKVDSIRKETDAEKVNIIAHSKGGIEARYMISSLGMGDKVASLTTISTPHHGIKTMDTYLAIPGAIRWVIGVVVSAGFMVVQWDRRPDFHAGTEALGTKYMEEFNAKNPDASGVYYQSWAGHMVTVMNDMFLAPPNIVIQYIDGDNDGMVPVESAKWTNFRGTVDGVSHNDFVDIRRMFSGLRFFGGPEDIRPFYVELVSELKDMGF